MHGGARAGIVIDDQQVSPLTGSEVQQALQRDADRFAADRFGQEPDGATIQPARAAVDGGDEVHRDRPCAVVGLQFVEYRPAIHRRQCDVQQDAGRVMFARQLQARFAIDGGQRAVALAMDHVDQDARERRIVLDHQDRGLAGQQRTAIVVDHLRQQMR